MPRYVRRVLYLASRSLLARPRICLAPLVLCLCVLPAIEISHSTPFARQTGPIHFLFVSRSHRSNSFFSGGRAAAISDERHHPCESRCRTRHDGTQELIVTGCGAHSVQGKPPTHPGTLKLKFSPGDTHERAIRYPHPMPAAVSGVIPPDVSSSNTITFAASPSNALEDQASLERFLHRDQPPGLPRPNAAQ